MKILLILTGGTIACKTQNHQINITSETADSILTVYQKINPNSNILFDVVQPLQTLSENHTAVTYNQMIQFLYETDFTSYDGIIMTHGSDTLSYTSALVGMLLPDISIPFMITASDYPLDNMMSNGISNFSACVRWIENSVCHGVFTVYGKKDFPCVYLSTRICEADPITDDFSAFGDGIVAQFHDNHITFINKEIVNLLKTSCRKKRFFQQPPVIRNDVLLIKTYPNQNFAMYTLENVSAVVIYLYHSGTACVVGNDYNICNFMRKCREKKIPVYTASHKWKTDNYVTTIESDKYTTFKICQTSKECAYIKTLLAVNQNEYLPDEVIRTNIFFEQE